MTKSSSIRMSQFGNERTQTSVYDWAKSFQKERNHVENEPRARRRRTSVNPDNNPMSFAVVVFRDGHEVSEVPDNWLIDKENEKYCWWPPAHVKNLTSLIANRATPNESTWSLLNVTVEKFCNTIEKARKIAEDSQYSSTDEAELGKGYRKHKPAKRYQDMSSSESKEESNEEIATSIKCKRAKLSYDPLFTVRHYNNSIDQNVITKSISSHSVNDFETSIKERDSTTSTLQYNENSRERDVFNILKGLEEKLDNLTRICASFQMDFNDIQQRVDCITPVTNICGPTENIKKMLPLMSIEKINNFERFLKNEKNLIEYKTFIGKIGGHSARENIKRVLSSIFDDKLAKQCSLKGRKNNYGVEKLTIIKTIRDTILDAHSILTDIQFYDICAEWFRFANQRYQRREKKSSAREQILGP